VRRSFQRLAISGQLKERVERGGAIPIRHLLNSP
jgi:hypothetical protein